MPNILIVCKDTEAARTVKERTKEWSKVNNIKKIHNNHRVISRSKIYLVLNFEDAQNRSNYIHIPRYVHAH